MMDDGAQGDICRVCRSEGDQQRPLFYPCVCTGSMKYIHQDCLVQWLRYSRKDICEICNYRFSFTPIYAPDMPKRLPIKDIITGLFTTFLQAIRFWLHYTLVAFAWLGIVPLSACRIHRSLFTGSVNSVLTLPLDLLSTEHLITDIFHGCVVVLCTMCIFISLVWLREHIMHGGGPDWLEGHQELFNQDEPLVDEALPPEGQQQQEEGVENNVEENRADNNGNNNEDVGWDPMNWDRAAEELTWERLLGLDGSLVFLEHVFWVVSLNTLFILVFEFLPYHIGHFTIHALKMEEYTKVSHFEGLLITMIGYCIVGISLVFLHFFASILRLRKSKKIVGLCYVVVKVCLLSCVEIGVFPLICGWWLDICSLSLFDATLKDREASFSKAPGTSFFMHWLFGMIYVFYFASFVLLLREVLRPGVLWFLRNLNDPDFNPIQEMIHLPILRHIRRFLFSIIIFGTTVLLMVWLPVRLIKKFWPTFLPFTFVYTTEQTHELSLELILLQVIMPALLEQGHSREWLKKLIRYWCICVAWFLDLRSYLLGGEGVAEGAPNEEVDPDPQGEEPLENDVNDVEEVPPQPQPQEEVEQHLVENAPPPPPPPAQELPQQEPDGIGFGIGGGLAQAHQALLARDVPSGFQLYRRPKYFSMKIFLLIGAMCLSLTLTSVAIITVPVTVGRFLMAMWLTKSEEPIHELYTTAAGLYVSLFLIRLIALLISWIPRGWSTLMETVKRWSVTVLKSVIALFLLVGVIPFLAGLLIELFVITPLRVPINQTPLYSASENWVMGTLYVKIACAVSMMAGPNFWLRRSLERLYNDGLRNIRLNFIIKELAAPCIVCLGLTLASPYVISQSIVPLFTSNFETQNMVKRRIFPFFLIIICILLILLFQVRQFKKLLQSIKNDKYLVGRRLVNYERPNFSSQNASLSPGPTPPIEVDQPLLENEMEDPLEE